ncbi:TraR/DksA family transcriptional regulator [Rhodospirillum sp. A1_3_36]|uniref:TraR/DksA family transcriptional regulator n=1 Tax=Rhodospirillum sp. A1_3_36 TaxID=3391666 RepID=UPI0039A64E01
MGGSRPSGPSAPVADDGDRAQAEMERHLAQALSAHKSRQQVNGTGFCEDCGCEIPPNRLAVLPWAARCLDCQGDHERDMRA